MDQTQKKCFECVRAALFPEEQRSDEKGAIFRRIAKDFVKNQLGLKVSAVGGNERIETGSGGYTFQSAVKKLERIVANDPPFPTTSENANSGQQRFEVALVQYCRRILGENVPADVFRRVYEGKVTLHASMSLLNDPRSHGEFLVGRFLDLATGGGEEVHLDSSKTDSVFFFCAIDAGSVLDRSSIWRVIFSDLLPDDNFSFDQFSLENMPQFEVQRVQTQSRPRISRDEFMRVIATRYSLIDTVELDLRDMSVDSRNEFLRDLQRKALEKFLGLAVAIIDGHMIRLQQTFSAGLNSGSLMRTVFDVEHGAVFVNLADDQYWTFAMAPIQGRVPAADRRISEEIVSFYQSKLEQWRTSL